MWTLVYIGVKGMVLNSDISWFAHRPNRGRKGSQVNEGYCNKRARTQTIDEICTGEYYRRIEGQGRIAQQELFSLPTMHNDNHIKRGRASDNSVVCLCFPTTRVTLNKWFRKQSLHYLQHNFHKLYIALSHIHLFHATNTHNQHFTLIWVQI